MSKILIPQNNLKTYDVIHIFAESSVLSTQYIYENTPIEIQQKNVIIYLEPGETYEISKRKINELFIELGLTIKSESLISVYESSLEILGVYSQNFKFIGLIDPLLKNNNLLLNFNINTNLLYNNKNWVNLPLNQTLLSRLANKLTLSSQKEEKDLTKVELLDYFFKKYKSDLT